MKGSKGCVVVKPVVARVSGWALPGDSGRVQNSQGHYPRLSGRPDENRNACGNHAIQIRIDQQIEARLGSADYARLSELICGSLSAQIVDHILVGAGKNTY
jgi:hypothetical protein